MKRPAQLLPTLCSAFCRILAWLFDSLCGGYNFIALKREASGQLPIWCRNYAGVDKSSCSARLPLLASKWSSDVAIDGGSNMIRSPQMVGALQIKPANLLSGKTVVHQNLYHQSDVKLLSLAPMHGAYNWGHCFELPQQGRGLVLFTVDCSNDVHVAISPRPQSMEPMYELVIGGWNNTTSLIRRKSQGSNLCTVSVGLNKLQSGTTMNDLWVSIDKTSKFVRMGQGRESSVESMFFIYKDLQFLSEAQYVCFTTGDVSATYSNIRVLAM